MNYFGPTNGYMRLDVWILANIIQLATLDFCRRYLTPIVDPCGRQFDQMTQAARSGQANIAEGLARGKTSKETEMRLLDVARASLAELNGDYTSWLMQVCAAPWRHDSPEFKAVSDVQLDATDYGDDWTHDACQHILRQKQKFADWLESNDDRVIANTLLILIARCIGALNHLMEAKLAEFKSSGGFAENLTKIRLAEREAAAQAEGAPPCPICGKVMVKRTAKRGRNAGHEFWSCSGYPDCNGTRKV